MRHNPIWLVCIVLVACLTAGSRGFAEDEPGVAISPEHTSATTRLRTSLAYYHFNINHKPVTGEGPDFTCEWSLGERWSAGVGISQVYSYGASMQTLFTEVEGGLWYSVWGSFLRTEQRWREHGDVVVSYRRQAQAGLRLGLSLQQYFFNTSKAAVPFSGVAARALYELGLDLPFDVGLGAEFARLSNQDTKAQSVKVLMSLIWPFAAG